MDRYISYITRYPKTLATALLIGYPIANVVYLHWSLSRTIQHGKESKRLTSAVKKTISSIPEEALSSDHVMVHDVSDNPRDWEIHCGCSVLTYISSSGHSDRYQLLKCQI